MWRRRRAWLRRRRGRRFIAATEHDLLTEPQRDPVVVPVFNCAEVDRLRRLAAADARDAHNGLRRFGGAS